MQFILQIIQKIIQSGVNEDLSRGLAKKIRVTNAVCLIIVAVTLPYTFIFTLMGFPLLGLLVLPIASAYAGFIYLNSLGQYNLARNSLTSLFNSVVFGYSLAFGLDSGIYLLFFPLSCMPAIIFERRDYLSLLWGVFLAGMFLTLALIFGGKPQIEISAFYAQIIYFSLLPTTFILLAGSVYYLSVANGRVEEELSIALHDLQSQTKQSHQILDAITDMVVLKGMGSRLLWGNQAFRDHYGLSLDDMKRIIEESQGYSEMSEKSLQDDQAVLEKGKVLVVPEETLINKNGVARIFNTVRSPIRGPDQINMMVAVHRDITLQKEMEELVVKQRSQMVAASKFSAIGEIAAEIAHEINNPLTIITGRSSNLKRLIQKEPENKARMLEFMNDIEGTALRIAKIIKGLRSLARSNESNALLPTPIADILEDTLAFCEARFKSRGVALHLDKLPQDAIIECRPLHISQVLINLLGNAFDATEDAAEQWVKVSVSAEGGGFKIVVKDSGSGIPLECQSYIFQPFFTTKNLGKGTGLGLSISRDIIKDHGGSIAFDPQALHTTVVVWLPRAQDHQLRKKYVS